MTTLSALLASVPQPLRRASQLDRILVEETLQSGGGSRTRRAIDLAAGCTPGSPFLGVYTEPVSPEALVELDGVLAGVAIERVSLRGARLGDAGLQRLLGTRWLESVRELDLGDCGLTSRGVAELIASPAMDRLRCLRLANDDVAAALSGIASSSLEELSLSQCGLSEDALAGLGAASLPALRRLSLHASARWVSGSSQVEAFKDGGELPEARYGAAAWRGLMQSPLAAQLEQLWLTHFALDAKAAAVIGGAALGALRRLTLDGTRLGDAGLTALASAGGLPSLEHLSLDAVGLERAASAMTALASAAWAPRLGSLVLSRNALSASDLAALFGGALALHELDLDHCRVGDAGCRALCAAEQPLTHLKLAGNAVTAAGVRALLEARFVPSLVLLVLWNNPIGDEGCAAVVSCAELARLERLSLAGTGATDALLPALRQSPVLGRLSALNLHDNRLSDDAASLIAARAPGLTLLVLSSNGLTARGVAALQQSLSACRLALEGQDPSKLPPRLLGSESLGLVPLPSAPARPPEPHVSPKARAKLSPSASVALRRHEDRWALALEKKGGALVPSFVATSGAKVTRVELALEVSEVGWDVAPSQKQCALVCAAGLFVVDLKSGKAARIGDAPSSLARAVCFCGDHLVVLDRDGATPGRNRLDFHLDRKGWKLVGSVRGLPQELSELTSIAARQVVVVHGTSGALLVAARDGQWRYLGHTRSRLELFSTDRVLKPTSRRSGGGKWVKGDAERTYAVTAGSGFELTGVDAALAAAFAPGTSEEASQARVDEAFL